MNLQGKCVCVTGEEMRLFQNFWGPAARAHTPRQGASFSIDEFHATRFMEACMIWKVKVSSLVQLPMPDQKRVIDQASVDAGVTG